MDCDLRIVTPIIDKIIVRNLDFENVGIDEGFGFLRILK